MTQIPRCQQCGKKIYKRYGGRGHLPIFDSQYHYLNFDTAEERDRHEIPSNAYDINRRDPSDWDNTFRLNYFTPQEPKDGLFCSRNCSDHWQMQNRNILESLMKSNTFKNPWKGA
jgi:hypothetical protein